MRLSLHRAMLSYGGGLLLHTASSGPVAGLDTLYLALQDADGITATGEVRINIAYLNGLAAEDVVTEALALLPRLDLTPAPETLLAAPPPLLSRAAAPLRMLVDLALHDLAAKRAGQPLAAFLSKSDLGKSELGTSDLGKSEAGPVSYATNQTLFISDDATFLRQAQAYVARGFRDLKVRIGAADFADDLAASAVCARASAPASRSRSMRTRPGAWRMRRHGLRRWRRSISPMSSNRSRRLASICWRGSPRPAPSRSCSTRALGARMTRCAWPAVATG
jgi:hypothetical protein